MRARVKAATIAIAIAAAVAVTSACGGGNGDPGSCPNLLPAACPAPAPTFSADAGPVIQARCTTPCHAPGGQEAVRPFQTYDQIFAQRTSILTQVHACKMPPAGATPLTDMEKVTLLGWLKCGAPND